VCLIERAKRSHMFARIEACRNAEARRLALFRIELGEANTNSLSRNRRFARKLHAFFKTHRLNGNGFLAFDRDQQRLKAAGLTHDRR